MVEIIFGVETIPLFMKRLNLAFFFTDGLQAEVQPFELRIARFKRSVGAEIVSSAQIGLRIPLSLRLGYAHGFLEAAEQQRDVFLGRWF